MVSFKDTFVNTFLIALFIIAMITFAVRMQEDNLATHTVLENEAINKIYINLSATLGNPSREKIDDQRQALADDPPSQVNEVGVLSLVKTALSLPVLIINIFDAIGELLQKSLGIPKEITYMITIIILIITISIAISLWRTGK